MNAKQELIYHVRNRQVKYVSIHCKGRTINGTLEEVLPQLDFNYHDGYGSQELFGTIWYEDGTWADRSEYDGSEWWEDNECPELPAAYYEKKR